MIIEITKEKLDKLYARIELLEDLLQDCEWVWDEARRVRLCSWCDHPESLGHLSTCELAKALQEKK